MVINTRGSDTLIVINITVSHRICYVLFPLAIVLHPLGRIKALLGDFLWETQRMDDLGGLGWVGVYVLGWVGGWVGG